MNMNTARDKKIALGMLIAFAVLALLYFAQSVYNSSTGKIEYDFAFSYTQEEKLKATGFAVRDENRILDGENTSILVKKSDKVYVPVISDSANVSKKDILAFTFDNDQQAENYIRVQELKEKLTDLRELKSQGDLSYVNVVYLNSSIYNSVEDYIETISLSNLSGLDSAVSSFTSKMSTKQIATGDSFDIDSQIKALEKEIKALEKTYNTSKGVKASYPGYFVSNVDGYENTKSYNDVKNKIVSVNEGSTLINSKKSKVDGSFGKIIGQHTWYFIFDTSITDASVIRTGYYVTVDFPEKSIEDITMKVHNVSELNGDKITVTLQCTAMNEELANLRIEDVEITVKSYEGYRIDSRAITENDEGLKGVNVILGTYVRFTPISIIYYGDDYVIAEKYVAYKEDEDGNTVVDTEKTSQYRSLKLYDMVIVKGMNVVDGMLIS